ncbi:MAG: hypothetical protein ACYTHN_21395, partial [Planctomycetota bacterium]
STTGDYTVTWASALTATSYDLEEDTSSSFTNPTLIPNLPGTMVSVTGKPQGTYYYRARATNASGSSSWVEGANGCVVSLSAILQAQSITVVAAPVTVTVGGSFDAVREILNAGALAGTTAYTILLSDDTDITIADAVALSDTTASIDPGVTDSATVTCVVPATLTPGDYYVGLYIDATNLVCTVNADVRVVAAPPPPPPASDDHQSCGCSPVGGMATPSDLLGMILPVLLWASALLYFRRRRP